MKLGKEEITHVPNTMVSLLVARLLLDVDIDEEEEENGGDSLVGTGEGMDCRQPNTTILSVNPQNG